MGYIKAKMGGEKQADNYTHGDMATFLLNSKGIKLLCFVKTKILVK